MKKLSFAIAALSLATSAAFVSTSATAEVSANAAVTSNYIWRGLEQTGGETAVSGGIDYSNESGFYAGTWASNAFTGTELDLYAGFSADINETTSYDVGFIYYAYPDIDDSDFSEIYGSITFTGLTLGAAILTSSEDLDFGDSVYLTADYAITLSNEAEVNFHIGNYSGDFAGNDSTDIGVSISKDNFTFGVSKVEFSDDVTDNSDDMKFYVSYAVDIAM